MTTSKFKVGDKVRVIADYCCHEFPIGSIREITRIEGDRYYSASIDGDYGNCEDNFFQNEDIELLESKPKFKVGDYVEIIGCDGCTYKGELVSNGRDSGVYIKEWENLRSDYSYDLNNPSFWEKGRKLITHKSGSYPENNYIPGVLTKESLDRAMYSLRYNNMFTGFDTLDSNYSDVYRTHYVIGLSPKEKNRIEEDLAKLK